MSAVYLPANPGWFAGLAAGTAGVPMCKQPVIGWVLYVREEDGRIDVEPISINGNRNDCWGCSKAYFLCSPDGKFFAADTDGPVFDNEADATAYWVEAEKDQRVKIVAVNNDGEK